ncbi:type II toxin-antitoxin system VapB family antitoxin [Klenkia sp. LSe6-5]|uniref:Type II toxin-antitoxin system VapB family antitoxin n=1 Tax=Klenkia sesuvii TaxID=3103137 RepID=A0ABU8DX38_9ACTN
MTVTTVDIDKELLAQARELLGTTTTKATVHEALRELVALRRQTAALDALAALDLDLDPDPHKVHPSP